MLRVRIFAYGPEEVWNYEIIRTEVSVRSLGPKLRTWTQKVRAEATSLFALFLRSYFCRRSSLCFSALFVPALFLRSCAFNTPEHSGKYISSPLKNLL